MTDREKVIKGLERCIVDDNAPCNCPYDGDGGCIGSLMCDAITLLKAQEPMVLKNSAGNGICPGCGRIIPAWSSPNYCGYCGQAVKWK